MGLEKTRFLERPGVAAASTLQIKLNQKATLFWEKNYSLLFVYTWFTSYVFDFFLLSTWSSWVMQATAAAAAGSQPLLGGLGDELGGKRGTVFVAFGWLFGCIFFDCFCRFLMMFGVFLFLFLVFFCVFMFFGCFFVFVFGIFLVCLFFVLFL